MSTMQPAEPTTLRSLLATLRRWRPAVLGGLAAGLALGAAAAMVLPRMYRATALVTQESSPPVVMLEQPGLANRAADQSPSQNPTSAAALAELLRSGTVRDGALARLARDLGPVGAKRALAHLQIRPVGQTPLVRITVDHRNPRVAVQAVDAVIAAAMDRDVRLRRSRVTGIRRAIEQELRAAAPRLSTSEDALAAFKSRHSDLVLANEAAIPDSVYPSPSSTSPLIATLQGQLAAQEIELSGLRQQFTEQHPQVIATEAKIQETRRRLSAETARRQEVPVEEREQIRLARSAKEAEIVYQILSEKLQQARIAEASIGSAITVVDPAREPRTPFRSRWLTIALGAILGLTVGAGGAWVRDGLSAPLVSLGEADQVLGLPVLGAIPLTSLPDQPASTVPRSPLLCSLLFGGARPAAARDAERRRAAVAEAFRYLRTNLLYRRWGALRAILVTSPGFVEERATVAANLAIALAQSGRRVWLLECDLRDPVLDGVATFQDALRDAGGIVRALAEGAPADGLLRSTAVPNLWYLPAAARPANPAELLAGAGMRALMEEGRRSADVLVLHAPPVHPLADAAILAQVVDGVLLVVHTGRTGEDSARKARDQLQAVGATLLGVAVTGVPPAAAGGAARRAPRETGDAVGALSEWQIQSAYAGRAPAAAGRMG